MKPKVSIIVTTYNRADALVKRSLPSVLGQTYNNFECIVVDDCSTDGTGEAMEALQKEDNRITYVKLPQNSGVSAARNSGVERAAGEYISFLDDDDELLPDFLQATVPILEGLPPEFGGVVVDRIRVLDNGDAIYQSLNLSKGFYHAISVGWLLRKSIFPRVRYDEELRSDVDADFGIQFFSFFKGKAVRQPLLLTYAHKGDEFGVTVPSEQRLVALDRFLKKNLPLFRSKSRGSRKDLEFIYRFAGQDYCRGGEMRKGIPFLWRAFLTRPDPRNFLNCLAAAFGHRAYVRYWGLESRLILYLRAHVTNPARGFTDLKKLR